MDCSLSLSSSRHSTRLSVPVLPSAVRPGWLLRQYSTSAPASFLGLKVQGRKSVSRGVVALAGSSYCEPGSSNSSSLNTPLEPRTSVGLYLSGVLQNHRQLFHVAVADELKALADGRDAAVARMVLGSASHEGVLHRRIAQLKEYECRIAIEDVMYMLILYKFSEIRVPLIPKLSKCIYNGRLEIWPTMDWWLESVHGVEVLQMIREHVCAVIGLRANASVKDIWATVEIQRQQLGAVYAASILYGYFLKNASLRHHLEQCLARSTKDVRLGQCSTPQFSESLPSGLTNLLLGQNGSTKRQEMKRENLRCYLLGFDSETLRVCAKPKSIEALNLIEKHSYALFGDEETSLLDNEEVILTSFSSMKRMILEAVAFGSFLWEAEEYVNSIYNLCELQL